MVKISPIDIEGIYTDYLNEKQEENRLKRYSGNESWYHASGSGSCSRKLYLATRNFRVVRKFSEFDSRASEMDHHTLNFSSFAKRARN